MHAATRIEAEDRAGLERLCRYVTRPPLAADRLQCIDTDHLTFRLKTPWSDGTTHLLLSPLELMEKLAALVPPPRLNLLRYHGILAPNARHRSQVVPAPPSPALRSRRRPAPSDLLGGVVGPGLRPRCDPLSRLWRTTAPDRRAYRSRIHSALSARRRATDPAPAA